jgi:hypothetical protein
LMMHWNNAIRTRSVTIQVQSNPSQSWALFQVETLLY